MKVDKKVTDFIEKHRVSALTTVLSDGRPHSAAMHYATAGGSLEFVFFTREKSRKCENFVSGKKYPASLIIGFSEEEWAELQMEGLIEKIERSKSGNEVKIFASKFAGAKLDPDHTVLKFRPNWWRYSEFKPEFKKMESK